MSIKIKRDAKGNETGSSIGKKLVEFDPEKGKYREVELGTVKSRKCTYTYMNSVPSNPEKSKKKKDKGGKYARSND